MNVRQRFFTAITVAALVYSCSASAGGTQKITLIHIGDTHGQIEPAVNVRSDNTNKDLEGGLARMYTLVKKIRKNADAKGRTHFTFLVGDTSHGGVEVTFTRGDGIVGILNEFDIDLFAPGNWEFTYGTCRANELWGFTDEARGILDGNSRIKDTSNGSFPPLHKVDGSPQDCDFSRATLANWPTLASNAYIDNDRNSANCPPVGERTRLFEPYQIVEDPSTGINIGVIAFTTERGPRVIGNPVVEGICFTKGDEEIIELVELMNQKREAGEVDMVVMTSELNHANNRRLIDMVDEELGPGGVDLVLSADMHERTPKIIYTKNGTAMVSQGQDGSHIGELSLTFKNKKLSKLDFKQHRVEEAVKEDPEIAEMVEAVREPFLNGTSDDRHFVHGRMIPKDIVNPGVKHFGVEEPLAIAGMDLNRNNFTHEYTAAIYEGTLHSLFTDALRATGKRLIDDKLANGDLDVGADFESLCATFDDDTCEAALPVMGLIRGFRYATSVRAGEPITLETLYHIAPIGPFATVGVVTGEVLLGRGAAVNGDPTANGLEHAAHLSLSTNVREWGGGWLQTYAGMKYSLNPYAAKDKRIPNDKVLIGTDAEGYTPVDPAGKYIIVGYGFNDVVFGTDSGANEYVFVNKPFKMNQAGLGNVWRVVFDNDDYSTLDTSNNPLDLVAVPFAATDGTNPDIYSLPVVDLVARYLLDNYPAEPFMLQEPVSRVSVLCQQPNMAAVKNTKNSQVLDADFPIVDIGFPMIQSIFGANRNLIPFLNDGRLQECVDNGIIEISSGQITYTGD